MINSGVILLWSRAAAGTALTGAAAGGQALGGLGLGVVGQQDGRHGQQVENHGHEQGHVAHGQAVPQDHDAEGSPQQTGDQGPLHLTLAKGEPRKEVAGHHGQHHRQQGEDVLLHHRVLGPALIVGHDPKAAHQTGQQHTDGLHLLAALHLLDGEPDSRGSGQTGHPQDGPHDAHSADAGEEIHRGGDKGLHVEESGRQQQDRPGRPGGFHGDRSREKG